MIIYFKRSLYSFEIRHSLIIGNDNKLPVSSYSYKPVILFLFILQDQARRIIPNISAIIANTNKIWIKPVTLYTKTPSSHPIIKITAMI